MKKALLLVSVLAISVVTTACINKFAVQELNNKATSYIEQGNYTEAIERLKSSIDLDDSVFESHYNLAVAYTKSDDYVNALNSYKKAIELNPEHADTYYSLAVTEENIVSDLKAQILTLDESGNLAKNKEEDPTPKVKSLPQNVENYINDLLTDAVNNYNEYLTKTPSSNDKEELQQHISEIEQKISDNTTQPEE